MLLFRNVQGMYQRFPVQGMVANGADPGSYVVETSNVRAASGKRNCGTIDAGRDFSKGSVDTFL